MEESFLTVSYLAGQCDSQAERAAAASAFKLAAAHVHEPIQSCQLQLHTINNKFHQLYKEFQQLTLTAMDVQQTQYTNMLAMWTMQHCAKIVKGTAQTMDIPPRYDHFTIPQPPPEVINEFRPFFVEMAAIPQRASTQGCITHHKRQTSIQPSMYQNTAEPINKPHTHKNSQLRLQGRRKVN